MMRARRIGFAQLGQSKTLSWDCCGCCMTDLGKVVLNCSARKAMAQRKPRKKLHLLKGEVQSKVHRAEPRRERVGQDAGRRPRGRRIAGGESRKIKLFQCL